MLIRRVIRRRWERSDVDQRPACGSKRHVTRSQALITFPVLEGGIDPSPDQATWATHDEARALAELDVARNGDGCGATWWRDVKLMRLPRTDLSIQLGSGRPLVA